MGGFRALELVPGDLVFVVHDSSSVTRNEEIATKAVVLQKIPDSIWYRVYMSWSGKTRVTDFPVHMLKKATTRE